MYVLPHISSPISAPWVAWVMLCLLLCCVLAEIVQRGAIVQAFSTLFSKMERAYGDAQQNMLEQLIIMVFCIGSFAMALYLFTYRGGDFRFATYMLTSALVLCVDVIKWAVSALVNYTFGISKRLAQLSTHRNNMQTVICILFYTASLCLLRVGNQEVVRWVLGGCAVVALVLICIKWIRVFCVDIRSLLYILLYVLTLEVLPLLVLLVGADYIVEYMSM